MHDSTQLRPLFIHCQAVTLMADRTDNIIRDKPETLDEFNTIPSANYGDGI